MGKEKGFVKEGGSRVAFWENWIFPQDRQGFITAINDRKATKRGWSDQIEGVFAFSNGDARKLSGSVDSPFGNWISKKKNGDKVRIVYNGGSKKGGVELPKGLKDYKAFKKWKGSKAFYGDFEFYGVKK